MLWVTFLVIAYARAQTHTLKEGDRSQGNGFLINELSLTYDHCRFPQTLNRETWICECPDPLEKKGDKCVCEGCLFVSKNESYAEKDGSKVPEYIAPFVRDLNEDEEEERKISESSGDGVARRILSRRKRALSKKKMILKKKYGKPLTKEEKRIIQGSVRQIMRILGSVAFRPVCGGGIPGRRSNPLKNARVMLAKGDGALYNFLRGLELNRRRKPEIRLRKVDWEKAKIMRLKHRKPADGETFSDSTIGDETRGSVAFGKDKAFGAVSNSFGTGSISLATGDGSAAATAYTGEGLSVMGAESIGAKAYGVGLIGKKSVGGTSTTTLLVGEGDAIATNSKSKKSSASATAIATKATASAASSAYGAATASASATPGKGSAKGSASYGEDLEVSAETSGNGGPVAETVAVGLPTDDIRDLAERGKRNPSDLRDKFFHRLREPPAEFDLGNDVSSDWLRK